MHDELTRGGSVQSRPKSSVPGAPSTTHARARRVKQVECRLRHAGGSAGGRATAGVGGRVNACNVYNSTAVTQRLHSYCETRDKGLTEAQKERNISTTFQASMRYLGDAETKRAKPRMSICTQCDSTTAAPIRFVSDNDDDDNGTVPQRIQKLDKNRAKPCKVSGDLGPPNRLDLHTFCDMRPKNYQKI